MRNNKFALTLGSLWGSAIVVAILSRFVLVAPRATTAELVAWALFIVGPVFIALTIVRAAPSRTVAQVLYDTEHP